jgi:hypothetical protein
METEYLRAHWEQTGIPAKDIDTNFGNATHAALHLGHRKTRQAFLGTPGRFHATESVSLTARVDYVVVRAL